MNRAPRGSLAEGEADAAVARRVTASALAVSLLLAAAVPLSYQYVSRSSVITEMETEAQIGTALLSEFVARRPDMWRFQAVGIERLLSIALHERFEENARWRVIDRAGTIIVELPAQVSWPTVTVRQHLLDRGAVQGTLEVTRSLRAHWLQTGLATLVAGLLALGAFVALRRGPMQVVTKALARERHRGEHDMLTGLGNRRRFAERLGVALEGGRRSDWVGAILFVDLDRFKPVNDLYGHAAGDRLLQLVSGRLLRVARDTDAVARLGGDEFAILADLGPGRGDETGTPPERAALLATRVVAALSLPFELGAGLRVRIGASVGVTLIPADGTDAEVLLRRADAALYRAKEGGRNGMRVFEASMETAMIRQAALEAELRLAIERNEIVAHFQPLVMLGTGRLTGFETLARWTTVPGGVLVPPSTFIPVAEQVGLIVPLTRHLLRLACEAAAGWPAELTVSVNFSSGHLQDPEMASMVRQALEASGLAPSRLEIELTESAFLEDFAAARVNLLGLKAIGVRLALDDFGTGYSSLRNLWMLPLDKIKIDAEFIRAVPNDLGAAKIVAAAIGLGHSLSLLTVAEGVEDAALADRLAEMGCDIGQGWFYGAALPPERAHALAHGDAAAAGVLVEAHPTAPRWTRRTWQPARP